MTKMVLGRPCHDQVLLTKQDVQDAVKHVKVSIFADPHQLHSHDQFWPRFIDSVRGPAGGLPICWNYGAVGRYCECVPSEIWRRCASNRAHGEQEAGRTGTFWCCFVIAFPVRVCPFRFTAPLCVVVCLFVFSRTSLEIFEIMLTKLFMLRPWKSLKSKLN